MKRISIIISAMAIMGIAGVITITTATADNAVAQVHTGEQTMTYSIDKMTCAMCPVTVKKAMKRVDGVKSVKVDFDSKTAVVVFDSSVATADEIAAASTNVGYPAIAVE